jgi:hypothetical protein
MSESLSGSVEPTAAPSTVNRSHERTDGLTEMVVTEGGNLSGRNARDEDEINPEGWGQTSSPGIRRMALKATADAVDAAKRKGGRR